MSLNRRKLTAGTRLAAADATKALVAAPGAGNALRIFKVNATCHTAAAQLIEVGRDGGAITEQLFTIPASSTTPVVWESEEGFLLAANIALSAKPGAAGPAWQFFVEYQIEKL